MRGRGSAAVWGVARRLAWVIVLLAAAVLAGTGGGRADELDTAAEQLSQQTEKAAELLVNIHRELTVYDRVLEMRVLRGALNEQQAADQLRQRADELAKGSVTAAAQDDEMRQEAALFFAAIEKAAADSPHWPGVQSADYYRALVKVILDRVRPEFDQRLAAHLDVTPQLDDAFRALALTRGQEHPAETPFSNPGKRLAVAMDMPTEPSDLPPAPPPSNRLEPGVLRQGSNLTVMDVDSGDPLDCESACEKNPQCLAFSFSYAPPSGGKARCSLKNAVPAPKANACCVSGVMAGRTPAAVNEPPKPAPAPAPAKTATISLDDNTDRPGLDYRNFVPSAADPNQCKDACEKDERCRAFSYNRPAQNRPARCWLKAAIPDAFAGKCCAAGAKGAREPGAVKALFEKHNLVGTFAWDCSKPVSPDNQYFINKVVDPDHVEREHSTGPGEPGTKTIITAAVELEPGQIAVSGTIDGKPAIGRWRVEPQRMASVAASTDYRTLIDNGKVVATGKPVRWYNRCNP